MGRQPPPSPLFPYTTLFRSIGRALPFFGDAVTFLASFAGVWLIRRPLQEAREVEPGGHAAALDRKSTRLNSSHPVISYAAFCMKKNTIKQHKRCGSRRSRHR